MRKSASALSLSIRLNNGRDLTAAFGGAGAASLLGRSTLGRSRGDTSSGRATSARLATFLELLEMLSVARVMLASIYRGEK